MKIKNLILFVSLVVNFSAIGQSKNDTRININQILFSYYSGMTTVAPLLEMPNYRLNIESNGNAILKWSRNCPQSRNNYLICSYQGSFSKKEFKQLARYLLKIDFLNLKEKYIQELGPNEEPYEDWGDASFTIFYNNNYSKTVVDENLEMPQLVKLRKKLVKLKKKIKWTPVVN
ncbi:MAG: hypothetical protein KA445_02360 [Sediminibacterium sp.]|nr:hypothetical protein [Sediminibacterium sp.]